MLKKRIAFLIIFCIYAFFLYSYTNGKNTLEYIKSLPERVELLPYSVFKSLVQLSDSVNCYLEQEDYYIAIGFGKEIKHITENYLGKDCSEYLLSLEPLIEYNNLIGNYREAIIFCEEGINIIDRNIGKNNEKYVAWLSSLATCNSLQGKFKEAISIGEEALRIHTALYGEEDSAFFQLKNLYSSYVKSAKVDSLIESGARKFSDGKYLDARLEVEKALDVSEREYGQESLKYANALAWLSFVYSNSKDSLLKAIELAEEARGIYENLHSRTNTDYVNMLLNLANSYELNENMIDAIRIRKKALCVQERICGKDFPGYVQALYRLIQCCAKVSLWQETVNWGGEMLRALEKENGNDNTIYADGLWLHGFNNNMNHNYQDALHYAYEALKIYEKEYGKQSAEYAKTIAVIASSYSGMGNYMESIRLGQEALQIRDSVVGNEHMDYIESLSNLYKDYYAIGNYSEAMKLCSKALNIIEKLKGKDNKQYLATLNILILCEIRIGDYPTAIQKSFEKLQILEEMNQKDSIAYVASLGQLAQCYGEMGNMEECIRLFSEELLLELQLDLEETLYHAQTLTNYAHYAGMCGAIETAIDACNTALQIYEQYENDSMSKRDESSPMDIYKYAIKEYESEIKEELYASILSNLASCHNSLKNHKEAIDFGTKALQIVKQKIGIEHQTYIKYLNNLASYYYCVGNYQEAIRLGTEAVHIAEKLGLEHRSPSYLELLLGMVIYHHNQEDIPSLEQYTNSCFNAYSQMITETFCNSTEYERNMFWDTKHKIFTFLLPRLSYLVPSDSLVVCGYNATLLSKGLLLSLSKEMSEMIKNSDDERLNMLYENVKSNRLILQSLFEKPIAERMTNTDSLEIVTQNMERELMERSKEYGDYTKNINIRWKDVEQKLRNGDVAVEFVSFDLNEDSTMYIAYVLQKNMVYPILVPLFEEKQLHKNKNLYTTSEVSNLIWKPLAKYLNGVKNVYFSPSGELYNIAIESLPHWSDDCLMSDKWNMYRLSSTRELVLVKDKNDIKQATIYGGVEYDTDEQTLAANSRMFARTRAMNIPSLYQLADTLNMRSGVNYLPSTKEEVVEINNTLSQKKVKTNLRTESLATESDFKNLDGKNVNLIHVATHGFYWTEREARYHDDLSFLMIDNKNLKYVEDKTLTRSGLLMAGANNTLMGKQIPEGIDDGILTAKEISQLDLRCSDLVVLSACQTGLGEIKGDGVFGLQRGFKKAGVPSILMSLWKVDDDATKLLMTHFYKKLISGASKHEALKQAQKYVREYNRKNYQDPYYWAAFVLLDAID